MKFKLKIAPKWRFLRFQDASHFVYRSQNILKSTIEGKHTFMVGAPKFRHPAHGTTLKILGN